jgi:hypothetical protein
MRSLKAISLGVLGLATATCLTGCGSSPEGDAVEATVIEAKPKLLAWEDFKRDAERVGPDGTVYYIVEWDVPVLNERDLRIYYDTVASGEVTKGVLHLHGGEDDVWLGGDQLRLRYCVDTGFDTLPTNVNQAAMIDAMAQATRAWQRVARVKFTYDPGNNGNCASGSPIPDSRYIKISRFNGFSGGTIACAFGPQSHALWTCPGLDGNTIGVKATASVSSWPGVMMHELGHALGLHHEQFHSNGGGCGGLDVRDVTPEVDLISVMGYPSSVQPCANTTPLPDRLSPGDGLTMRRLYGMPASWYEVILW